MADDTAASTTKPSYFYLLNDVIIFTIVFRLEISFIGIRTKPPLGWSAALLSSFCVKKICYSPLMFCHAPNIIRNLIVIIFACRRCGLLDFEVILWG